MVLLSTDPTRATSGRNRRGYCTCTPLTPRCCNLWFTVHTHLPARSSARRPGKPVLCAVLAQEVEGGLWIVWYGFSNELEIGTARSWGHPIMEELSQCSELHALGNDAKQRIKKLQEDYNRRLDSNNRTLTQKHKDEIMQLISSKLEAETEWLKEREQLQSLNLALEEKNARLTDQLDQLKKHDRKLDVLNQQLDRTIAQVMELKTANERLSAESTRLANENIGLKADANQLQDCESCRERLTLELGEAQQKIKEFTFKIEHLENELETARSFKREKNEGNEKLKKQIVKLSKEAAGYQQEIGRMGERETTLRGELVEKTTELQEELSERDRMLAFIERLQDEIRKREVLLADSFTKKPIIEKPEGLNFREFVHLKREVNYLREENEDLRLSERMKPLALPSLKGPSPGGDVKERKKNKASRNSASSSKSSILSISNIR